MKSLFSVAVLCLGFSAHADFDFLPAPEMRCTTSSNGYTFSREGRDPWATQDAVKAACRASAYTANIECDANVDCNDGRYYPPFVYCSTSSNGYNFRDESRDSSVARSQTIAQCTSSPYTNNNECSANVACSSGYDPYPPAPRMVSCETSSNGYRFADESRDASLARQQTISHCTSSPYTTNAECSANIWCNDQGYYPPMVTCGTSSNGYQFTDESRDVSLARAQAISKCSASPYTTNDECTANVGCNDRGYYPPFVTCTTMSNGYRFSDESRDQFVAQRQAVAQCTRSPYTNNRECEANVACERRY